jgi:hydroxymethylbilane synthase
MSTDAVRSVRLATRGSPLARRQAALVADLLTGADPGVRVETVVVSTEGDRRADVPLDRIGGQGVFTKEIQTAVLEGRADVAVHSAKDLPSQTPGGLVLAAVPERADARDALVGSTLSDLPPGGVVATGSARRRAQLANLRPDLGFVELRGNMDTRARRAEEGSVGAVVVAKAAFDRLGWSERIAQVLPVSMLLPQAGQGALALECRADDAASAALLAAVDDRAGHCTLAAERALLAALGADCSVPVGAWAEPLDGGRLRLDGLLASGDGRVVIRAALEGDDDDPVALGRRLARHLFEDCGGEAVTDWAGPSGAAP